MNHTMASVIKGVFAVVLTGLLSQNLFAQQQQPGQQQGEENQEGPIENVMLSDFEQAEDWRAFSTSPLGETETKKVMQKGEIRDVYNPDNLTAQEEEMFRDALENRQNPNHVLGVKGYIEDRGFDRIEAKPPHEYIIRGLGRQLSVWVLGRNYRHTLFAKFRDYTGELHKLRIGRLNFLGWRKLTITLPGWLPQSQRFSMVDKHLRFVSLYVVSDEHGTRGQFYWYVDNLKMKVDRSQMQYPGSLIKDTW